MTVEQQLTQEQIAEAKRWTKAQTPRAHGLEPSVIKTDGTKTIQQVVVASDAYPQQNRMGWKVKPSAESEEYTFFNIYPEDYAMIDQINKQRETGEPFPVVINNQGKAVLLRAWDVDPTHKRAVERANDLAEGRIDVHGNKKEAAPF